LKLLTRSTYYFLLFSILTMIIAGLTFYYTIRSIVYNQIDDSLETEKTIIQDQIEDTDSIPDFASSFGHLIEVRLLNSPTIYSQIIKDTDIYDIKSESYLPFRYISCSDNTPRNTGYIINIYQVVDEKKELLERIILGMFFLFLTLLLVSLIVNYLISKRIWNPFFETVNKAVNFNLLTDNPLELPETSINEFNQLNKIFEHMTRKMRTDYINLKEYNENASHEIQTPLAVIRSKMDMLMQNKNLKKSSRDLIKSVNEAITRLNKLNQGLLLISKIENLQFPETKEISLNDLIETCLDNYEEILQLKKIRIEKKISDLGLVQMNEILADIMISNLFSNAVRYNYDSGFIRCQLDNCCLTITNSGMPLNIDPAQLFNRFQKRTENPQSIGLGLSIVKKIVDYYKMHIEYTCIENIHEIKLTYRGE
jgi:signal transduction histidine kinase